MLLGQFHWLFVVLNQLPLSLTLRDEILRNHLRPTHCSLETDALLGFLSLPAALG